MKEIEEVARSAQVSLSIRTQLAEELGLTRGYWEKIIPVSNLFQLLEYLETVKYSASGR